MIQTQLILWLFYLTTTQRCDAFKLEYLEEMVKEGIVFRDWLGKVKWHKASEAARVSKIDISSQECMKAVQYD